MQTLPSDGEWMEATARLALRARPCSRPNPGVAAIVVNDAGVLIGRGWTQAGGRPHAEAAALEQAGNLTGNGARGATIYTTLEPCAHRSERGPSCTDLIIAAKPARLVVGQIDPDPRTAGEGMKRIAAAGVTVTELRSPAAAASLSGYLTRRKHARPHVTLKLAMSLDGCIALASGESHWITGEAARAHVHSRRALADAILVGGGTWRADLPRLNVRLPGLESRSPRRILLTRGVAPDGVKIINTPGQIGQLRDTQYLYVEGGAQTAAAFLGRDMVDRLEIYRAPILIGSGHNALGDIGLGDLSAAHSRWSLAERRQLGSDSYEAYQRIRTD